MAQLSFKNRIAFSYILITGLLIFVVFLAIYYIVKYTVYNHVDNAISIEIENHLEEINTKNGTLYLIDLDEWKEREHITIDVNPVFIQFLDTNKVIIEKSPNLKKQSLAYNSKAAPYEFFDTTMFGYTIRQVQLPFYVNKEKRGYLMIAMSLSDSKKVLDKLFDVMSIAFPVILLLLFFLARFFAGRSIQPINSIIGTANSITKDHLKARIPLPQNKDELYVLSQTINNLLERIEATIQREKQFTSDASHELRTPLTVIKGTLEVLIRKPRDTSEYHEKINYCISEVDRLNRLVDQLLLLARFENQRQQLKIEKVLFNDVISETILHFSNELKVKNCSISVSLSKEFYIKTDAHLLSIVLSNLVSNAIKYSRNDSKIEIIAKEKLEHFEFLIIDNGIGIAAHDLENVFEQFFRSKEALNSEVKGIGLGLSIVKKITELLNITITVSSEVGKGSVFRLVFEKSDND